MARFSIDLAGRVRNFNLPKKQALIPLFEAIVNSIYAIEERNLNNNGYINIQIVREPQEVIQGVSKEINKITGFIITDNGVGLNEPNMRSFLQSDSTYRAEKGGKGVGRFSWLKAFSKTEICSIYKEEQNIWVKREFEFSLENTEIDDRLVEIDNQNDNETCIKLMNYLPQYQKYVNKDASKIALQIMEHCMKYLLSPKCPIITVFDEESYCINQMFQELIEKEKEVVEFSVGKERFELLNTKIESASWGGNRLFLYANDRMVRQIELEKEIVDLEKNSFERNGFYYIGILSGQYLDHNVDISRTSFDIPEHKAEDEISIEDIVSVAKEKIEDYLSDYLTNVRQEKTEHIKSYIHTNAPQFAHLLKYMPDALEKIKPTLSDDKLDEELYRIKREFDRELKKTNQEIMKKINIGTANSLVYEEQFKDQFEKITESNKAALAEYVAHRKIILELLKKGIRKQNNGKFNIEAYIHDLIYPRRKTSEDIEFEAHNLWLIDERLAYCQYISSDIPFNNSQKEERTDILMLDNPVAIADEANTGTAYGTIIIFELKRPMRNDYDEKTNPITQLLNYLRKLSENKVADKNGRIINVDKNTQFYLYAICDLTPTLLKIADDNDFKETPDKLGLYKYHDKKHAYIEILSFDKIINDAEKRNRILFEKLGI